jgi:integrase
MASIYLRAADRNDDGSSPKKRKPVWWTQFYVTDPETGQLKQVRKSTGKTSKKKAAEAAADMERAAKQVIKAGTDKAQQAKAILAEAVTDLEKETFTPLTARKYLARLLEVATGEDLKSFTIETWCAEWLRRKARDSSPATMARYNSHLDAFGEWLGESRRRRPLESLTTATVRDWRESLQDAGRAGKTVQSYMKDLGAVYRAAIREGLTDFNPVTALEQISMDDSHDRKPFTGAEVGALILAAANLPEHVERFRKMKDQGKARTIAREWQGLILVAAFTGLRLGDASKLSWESVDLAGKKITLIPSKTKRKKREVCIPIQPDLLAYLEAVPIHSDKPDAPVFPILSKTGIGARAGLSQTFNKIMAAAGVDRGKPSRVIDEDTPKGKGRVTYERGFHSLRHTFTSWLRQAGVSEEDRMALTGHSTRESHAIYSHHDEAALREAVAKLPSIPSA